LNRHTTSLAYVVNLGVTLSKHLNSFRYHGEARISTNSLMARKIVYMMPQFLGNDNE
jgi:hypothetical protein